jgi:hypothetical protein
MQNFSPDILPVPRTKPDFLLLYHKYGPTYLQPAPNVVTLINAYFYHEMSITF